MIVGQGLFHHRHPEGIKFSVRKTRPWIDPYTGMTFSQASDLDIDHVVPLAHAHRTGGANWSREQKGQFANDSDNPLAVDDRTNQVKSDKGLVR